MKFLISESQFKSLYIMEDRPSFIDLSFIIETEGDDETHDVGEPGEPIEHRLYYFNIGERFYDKFYDEVYLELFNQYSDQEDCTVFAEAVIEKLLVKIKESVHNNSAAKILKNVIKDQKVIKFTLSDLQQVFEKHFSNIICHEFLQDIR